MSIHRKSLPGVSWLPYPQAFQLQLAVAFLIMELVFVFWIGGTEMYRAGAKWVCWAVSLCYRRFCAFRHWTRPTGWCICTLLLVLKSTWNKLFHRRFEHLIPTFKHTVRDSVFCGYVQFLMIIFAHVPLRLRNMVVEYARKKTWLFSENTPLFFSYPLFLAWMNRASVGPDEPVGNLSLLVRSSKAHPLINTTLR
jgi:hypothetical protein